MGVHPKGRWLSQTNATFRGYPQRVTKGLNRYYGTHDLHFITWSCYRRQPFLGSASRRDLLLKILEEARRKYRFVVHGYVVMPEHVHMLITEPEVGDPSVVMKVVKQRFSRQVKKDAGRLLLHSNDSGKMLPMPSGKNAFTILVFGANTNALRSCGTCIGIL